MVAYGLLSVMIVHNLQNGYNQWTDYKEHVYYLEQTP